MIKTLRKISTVGMSREEWLEHRMSTIGGSDASAILGMNSYASPYTVWGEKLGMLPPKEDSEAMRLGRDLEAYVSQRFTEATGKRVRRENNILYNEQYPFAHANVDRLIVGEDAGLECKTTSSLNLKKFKGGEFPDTYYVQCVHYLMVTGCAKWYLAVLVLGREFLWFEIERDEDEIAALAKSEADFWEYVKSKTPPPVDGTEPTSEAITQLHSESDGDSISLFGFDDEMSRYIDLGEQIKELKALQDEAANKIKVFMSDAAKGETDRFRVSWASQTRTTFDHKRLAAEHPELPLAQYYKESVSRPFKVSAIGE